MYREKKSTKFLSVILSVLMVVTMFPVIAITSVAATQDNGNGNSDDNGFTKPVTTGGGWEHELDKGYTDGHGTHYVSMKMDKTEFTFMQTKENEKFELTTLFSAMKNDGINYAVISSVNETHNGYYPLTTAWSARKDLNSKNTSDSPAGAALPGSLSQGYKKQLAQNKLYWDYTITFQGKGEAEYTTDILIDYKAGPYSMNTKEVNNYSTIDEPIILTIKVVDETQLIEIVENAKELMENGEVENTTALENLIATIENNHMTDGTVPFTQDEINAMIEAVDNLLPMDFSEYNTALNTARELINNPKVDQTIKDELANEITNIHPVDTVLSTGKDNKDYVAEATEALKEIIAKVIPTGVGNISDIPVNESTKAPGQWILNVDGQNDSKRWTNNNIQDSTRITLSATKVYLDKSESLDIYHIAWRAETKFAEAQLLDLNWRVAGPLSSKALNNTICGNDVVNFDDFFTGFNDANATNDNLVVGDKGYGDRHTRSTSANLNGALANDVQPSDTPYTVIPGLYVGNVRVRVAVIDTKDIYEIKTYSENLYSGSKNTRYFMGPYKEANGALSSNVSYPSFELYVYDKAPLKAAIDEAITVEFNGSANWNEWLQAIEEAKTVFNTREVTQGQVEAATASLTEFKFTYNATFTANEKTADIVVNSIDGTAVTPYSVKDKTIAFAFATVEAKGTVDYSFVKWSDGDTNAVRTINLTEDAQFNAEFTKNLADYTAVNEALAQVPENLTGYTAETVAALNKAIADVTEGLPLSQQDTVDGYAEAINNALANLEVAPANYSQLDAALTAATELPLDYVTNNEAKDELIAKIKEAQNLDRDLDASHQDEINDLANELLAALENITVLPADYSALEEALANAGLDNPESYYSEASIEEYNRALAKAEEVMATKGTADEFNILGQPEVDKAAQDLADALAGLTPNGECYYGALDKAIKEATALDTADFTPETLAAFEEALANAQAVERNMIDDNDGVNQAIIDAAAKNLIDATNTLEFNPADYTELDRQLAITPDFDETTASAESWADYQKALKDAEEISRNLTVLDQDYIDAIANALKDARENIAPLGECYYGDLNEQIAKAEALNEDDFTADSWAAIQTALQNANAIEKGLINDAEGVNQTAIDNAAAALKDAIKNAVEMIDVTITNNGEVVDTIKVEPGTTVDEAGILDAIKDSLGENEAVIGVYYADGTEVNPDDEVKYDFTADVHTVDTTDANDAIDNANDAINSGAYDEDSMKALQDAIDAIENFLDPETIHPITDNQATLDDLVEALQDVLDNLVPDKSGLADLIDDAKNTDTDGMTPESVKDLEDAIENAEEVLADPDATVEEIEDAIKAIEDAIAGLTPDKSDLEDLIADAEAIDQDKYTDETAEDLQKAIDDAKDVLGNPDATVEEIKDAIQNLQDAIDGLVPDKGDLNDLLDDAKNTDTTGKTDSSADALEDAIKNAEDVLADEDATVDDIDDAIKAIEDAIAGLEDKADYTDEEAAYDKATDIDTTNLSEEAKKALEDAIAAADALDKDLPAENQATVDAVTDALNDAIATAEKEALKDLLDDAKDTDTTGKTDASADALEDAIENAEEILGKTDPAATPEEIEDAIKAIEDAIAGLEDKADYTDEEAAYDKATDIDTTNLSEEAKKALEDAIAQADALDKDLPADEQATVDAVTDALIEAIKDAEKEILADKIKEAEDTDTEGMTDSSKEALEDAIENAKDVLADPDATPEEIEDAIKAIDDAIAGLTDEITITIVDDNGDVIAEITDKVGTTMGEIAEELKDEVPQKDGDKELVGYVDENGDLIPDDTVITDGMTIKPVYELTKITPKDDSVIGIDRRDDLTGTDGLIDGFTVGENTVAEIKALLENDEVEISIVNIEGEDLNETDLVGTGAVITYTSKLTGKVYEKLTVILYGDVNGDGAIDEADIDTLCAVAEADEIITNTYFLMAADCDGDEAIDGIDATYTICTANGIECIEQSRIVLK